MSYFLKDSLSVAMGVAIDTDCDREAGDVTGEDLHMDSESGYPSTQSQRADSQGIHRLQEFLFQGGDIRVRVGGSERTKESLLGNQSSLFKGPPQSHS